MAPFAPLVTSVMHGEHVKNSAHYAGRAIDVGAFGGVPVGMNEPTISGILGAMMSGRFEKIGTFEALAQNPQMQAYAHQYGVELFTDNGSGNHVHMQVGPA